MYFTQQLITTLVKKLMECWKKLLWAGNVLCSHDITKSVWRIEDRTDSNIREKASALSATTPTMLRDMTCGKENIVHYQDWPDAVATLTRRLKAGTWFGFAEEEIDIPKILWMKCEEMPPFFFIKEIPDEAVPQHMKDYMKRTGRRKDEE